MTLQPNNFLAPILTPSTPDARQPSLTKPQRRQHVPVVRPGQLASERPLGGDYGLRYDFFTIRSTEFAQGFGAFSPRFKLTRYLRKARQRSTRTSGVSSSRSPSKTSRPRRQQLLNLPLQPTPAQFDLKPERDTQLELGGHVPLGSASSVFASGKKTPTT